jgi:flagellar basal body-associated protein FliL
MKPEKPEPDAGQLLEMLDLQIRQQRARRQTGQQGRNAIRLLGIVIIIGMMLAALLLVWMLPGQMQRSGAAGKNEQARHP